MTQYSVISKSADMNGIEYESIHFTLSSAKREMKRLISLGCTDTTGSKTKIYANGDWVPCGKIILSGSNKSFIANAGMNQANY